MRPLPKAEFSAALLAFCAALALFALRAGGLQEDVSLRNGGPGAATRHGVGRDEDPVPHTEKLALLVGIDRYAPGTPAEVAPLSGCVRDVRLVRDVLVDRFGFPADEVLLLEDEHATHAAIVRAFHDHLVRRATPETEVVFWFSGHGSRVPDQSGAAAAEIEGKDSTLLAWDSRAGGEDGGYDLADDELRSLLVALSGRTSRITVVTDACHSGGATRGVKSPLDPRIRGVGDGSRPVDRERLLASVWPPDVPLLDDDDPRVGSGSTYVHLAACSPLQVAQEIDVDAEDGGTESHGALTFFLVQGLREARPGVSYRRIADDVAVRVSTLCPGQTVWAEGSLSRELFGARFEERPSGFRARAERVGERKIDVRIEAGAVHGLRPGSVVSLHRGGETLGTAEVKRVHAATSLARWNDPAPDAAPQGALRAVEETRPGVEQPLALHLADARLASLVEDSPRVRAVPAGDRSAEYELRMDRDGRVEFLGPGSVRIWKAANALSPEKPEERDVLRARLEEEFREELRYRALVALGAEPGSLSVEARFVDPEEAELLRFHSPRYDACFGARCRPEASVSGAAAGDVFRGYGTTVPDRELSLAMLVVRNPDSQPVHVAVLSVSEDRQRNSIWPQEGERDRVLEPGESVRIPVNVVSNPRWTEPRPMRDRYLVLATLDAADFSPLTRETPTRGQAPEVRMPEILALAMERPATRGMPRASTDRSAYGLCVVDLYVEPGDRR